MMLFIKLLLAHLLGDFILQPDSWIREKVLKKHKSRKLYLHALIHGLLTMAFVAEMSFWPYALFIGLTHFIIDWSKLVFQKIKTQRRWFFIDQILHLVILAGIAWWYLGVDLSVLLLNQDRYLVVITALVFLTLPASILIRVLISGWIPPTEDAPIASLQNAGKYIGMLERLLILLFILTDHWEGVGFLLAAKSIFRFGDLKESRDRKLTEYVMIGTLISFGIAILTALLTLYGY